MKKVVMIAGAGDSVGLRLVKDFLKKDYTVIAGLLDGQEGVCLPEEVMTVSINPLYHESAKDAAKAVEEKYGAIDMIVTNYDNCPVRENWTILDEVDFAAMKNAYEYNSLGPLRAIDSFLPLLEKGEGKRICVVTSTESSNNATRDIANFPSHVSKAPLNMAINQLFNGLRLERIQKDDRANAFTFRVYCKDINAGPGKAGEYAVEYFTRNRSNEVESFKHSDENRLVMRDWMNIEIPW